MSDNITPVYTTTDSGNLLSHLAIVDRVPPGHGRETPIDDQPEIDGHLFWTTLPVLRSKPIDEGDSFYQNVVIGHLAIALDNIVQLQAAE